MTERHIIAAALIALMLIGGALALWRAHYNSEVSRWKRRERLYWAEEEEFRAKRGEET